MGHLSTWKASSCNSFVHSFKPVVACAAVISSNRKHFSYLLSLINMTSRVCITVSNSPNPFSVHIRLCKHRKKVFYCFYEITFPRKNAKLFVMALIKREILTSHKVSYTKSCIRNQFLFCKKMLFKIRIFHA